MEEIDAKKFCNELLTKDHGSKLCAEFLQKNYAER